MYRMKFRIAPAVLLAALVPAAALAQSETTTFIAPGSMTKDQAKDWEKLDKQHDRLVDRIGRSNNRAAEAQTDLAKARERVTEAQEKLRKAERDLEQANERLADQREELAEVQAKMIGMGGARDMMAADLR